MKVLVADDDSVSRLLLESILREWDYAPVCAADGDETWRIISASQPVRLLVLDWVMPGIDGPELCQRVRARRDGELFYILLVTARGAKSDIVTGLKSGADDFVTKPFDRDELRARMAVGRRIVELQERLTQRVGDLERAMAEVQLLRGLLPICSYCRRVREGESYSRSVEAYFAAHTDAQFSHGVCPECYEKHMRQEIDSL